MKEENMTKKQENRTEYKQSEREGERIREQANKTRCTYFCRAFGYIFGCCCFLRLQMLPAYTHTNTCTHVVVRRHITFSFRSLCFFLLALCSSSYYYYFIYNFCRCCCALVLLSFVFCFVFMLHIFHSCNVV